MPSAAAAARSAREVPIARIGSRSPDVLKVRLNTSSRVTKLSQHEGDGGKFQEREGVAVEIFPILDETAAAVEPGNCAFDNPTLG